MLFFFAPCPAMSLLFLFFSFSLFLFFFLVRQNQNLCVIYILNLHKRINKGHGKGSFVFRDVLYIQNNRKSGWVGSGIIKKNGGIYGQVGY